MSQTWVIKDTAPVDEASYVLTETDISFTSGGEKFTKISIYNNQGTGVISLVYRSDNTAEIVATLSYIESESQFYWQPNNEKYKTLMRAIEKTEINCSKKLTGSKTIKILINSENSDSLNQYE